MNLKKIIKEEVDEFDWAREIEPKWEPQVGDKFICKPGFNRNSMSDYYGGAAYVEGKVYTIYRITPDLDDDNVVLWGKEDEDNNGVYKRATEPYFGYLSESEEDDFEWARGEVIFTINDIIGKKCTYRANNLSELEQKYNLSIFDFKRGDVDLGPVRYSNINNKYIYWVVSRLEGDDAFINLADGTELDYKIEEIEQYVNLGVWVLFGDNGNILNDFYK
jgi:hypothetical protein